MKKILKPYRHLASLVAVLIVAVCLALLGVPPLACAVMVGLWQLTQFAQSKGYRSGRVCIAALTDEQIKEFEKICNELKELGTHIPGLKELSTAEGGFAAIKKLPELLKGEQKRVDELESTVKTLKKNALAVSPTGVRWVGNVPFVTDDCAKALSSVLVLEAHKLGESAMRQLNKEQRSWESLVSLSKGYLGIETKAGGALTPVDIPLPTIYMPQVIELVFRYGQARQYCTLFPLGAGTVKLPRLQAGEDAFGFMGAGTGGMSQQVGQKEVTAALVTYTANKAGGLIRIPTELEEDTFIQLGQFLARYIAREFAKLEDTTLFMGDGTATYANITGIGTYCVNNPQYLVKPTAGNTVITDLTINNFRAMRALVNPAVLANMAATGQTSAAYYCHPSLEALFVTFNTIGTPQIYIPARNGQPATLDGWPIRWIGVSAANNANAQPNAFVAFFGDLSYWYFGERGVARVEVSREVFFATDELAMRALERIDFEAMALDAMSTLQLPPN
jgi:HK97 family phage major capsid protein